MWDEITHPFPNFNGATVEVWEWISNFIPHFTGHVIIHPCQDLIQSMLVKWVHDGTHQWHCLWNSIAICPVDSCISFNYISTGCPHFNPHNNFGIFAILICIHMASQRKCSNNSNKASEDAHPHLRPNQRDWKYRDGHQRAKIRPTCPKIKSFLKTPLTSAYTLFEINWPD